MASASGAALVVLRNTAPEHHHPKAPDVALAFGVGGKCTNAEYISLLAES
jgi:hypothetical protein